jgi:hypothetical protein
MTLSIETLDKGLLDAPCRLVGLLDDLPATAATQGLRRSAVAQLHQYAREGGNPEATGHDQEVNTQKPTIA